jgi:hypothetical protein
MAYVAQVFSKTRRVLAPPAHGIDGALKKIFLLLRALTGHDFTHYKRTTILRRIKRRMAVHKLARISDYVHYLQTQPMEVGRLFDDLLINVTGFFREPGSFEALREQVFPIIFDRPNSAAGAGRRVRVWVPGCATGEEVYSLAIAILEYLGDRALGTAIQIFGTDIDVNAIEKARTGIFGDQIVGQVVIMPLRRFAEQGGEHRIDAGFLPQFAQRGFIRVFARIDAALGHLPGFHHLIEALTSEDQASRIDQHYPHTGAIGQARLVFTRDG